MRIMGLLRPVQATYHTRPPNRLGSSPVPVETVNRPGRTTNVDGAKAMWWSKTVQLDLEAKGLLGREQSKPLRWHRAKGVRA